MKLDKSQLKMLIKECIVEVLEEGLASSTGQLAEGRAQQPRRKRNKQNRNLPPTRSPRRTTFNPALDTPVDNPAATVGNIRQAVALTAGSGIGGDMMSSILADTARTTLLEQDDHSGLGPGAPQDAAGLAMAQIDPLNLPGANNWAAAAGIAEDDE